MAKKDDSSSYSAEFLRSGSIMYSRIRADESTRKKNLKRTKIYNKYFSIPLYKIWLLPLIGLGRFWLLLQHKGRKTGKKELHLSSITVLMV